MSTIKQGKRQVGGDEGDQDRLRDISELLLTLGDIMMGRDDVHSAIDFYERAMKAERDAGYTREEVR